ncbi:MAG TPA: glucose-6-phosphate isomerase [Candidatus Hydrogenedentes bacterium]|nr:glucose-6-phosphate isomerase [Candidatus Hydrogenedentota bacterium]
MNKSRIDEIRVDVTRCMADAVGAEHGITPAELKAIAPRVREAHTILRRERRDKVYGFYDLYKHDAVFRNVKKKAAQFLDKGAENVVVLGIGGSALGTTALLTALKPPYYNTLDRKDRSGYPRLFVMDNIDPTTFAAMMRLCPPEKTLFNVISKSGDTAETVTQLLIVIDALKRSVGAARIKNHLVVTTNPPNAPKASLLRPVADLYGLDVFEVPLNVGGRFSVFSPVGMFPAALLGMKLDAMRAGCEAMDKRCGAGDLKTNPAYLRAAIHYLADTKKGKCMSVMMPYADGLRDVADWYRQLWAESLGKRKSLDGKDVYAGQTPIKSLGVTDQHSQVQLYREGPNNKIFTIIEAAAFDVTLRIPNLPDVLKAVPQFAYLSGHSMNSLMAAELLGTMDALKISRRPVIHVALPRINANTVAQLLYMLEVETAMAGRLYNVNTFDQPGVEEGKNIARALMAQKA